MFKNIFDVIRGCEYVPPCQRNPYYSTTETTGVYSDQTVYEADDMTPNLETVQNMCQCPKCGIYFILEPPTTMIFGIPQVETLCHECRRKMDNNDEQNI